MNINQKLQNAENHDLYHNSPLDIFIEKSTSASQLMHLKDGKNTVHLICISLIILQKT